MKPGNLTHSDKKIMFHAEKMMFHAKDDFCNDVHGKFIMSTIFNIIYMNGG